ncbi:MAG: glycosyl hydrolase [Ruminococcus sp.]
MKAKSIAKACAAIIAAAITVNSSAFSSVLFAETSEQIYEFEDGILTGATVQEKGTERYAEGASGDKFVFLQEGGETASVTANVEETGMYELTLCFSSPYGDKIHNYLVNGVDQGQFSCAETASGEWKEISLGVVKLNKGENEVAIKSSWGWTDIDYIKVSPATMSEISASDTTPCDPNATAETRSLMSYLASVYGKHIISGQQEIYSSGPHGLEQEFEYLNDKTGHYPAIRGFDYGNFCCPAFGSDDGSTERVIDWVKNRNGIATSSWHLNVPTDFESYNIGDRIDWSATTYTQNTDFSPTNAATEGTKENEYLMQALTTLAAEFKELEAQGIPIIWRPYHEAEGSGGETGSWFWWGREGSEAYKKLYIYTYEVLTEKFDCHNLIWEWNSYNYSTSANWYPGDEYVDIIGYDKYNCTDWSSGSAVLIHNDSAISSTFYGIMEKYNNKKMISMSENDCFSTVENLTSEKAGWLYFLTWYDGGSDNINFLTNPVFNTEKDTIDMYQSEYCITLDELPSDLYTAGSDVDPTKPTSTQPTSQNPTEPSTESPTQGNPDEIHADISAKTGYVQIDLPEAVGDKLYLNVMLDSSVTYANGGIGTSVEIGGDYYWVQVQWEAKKSGVVEVDMNNIFNVSLDTEEIDDEKIIAEAAELIKKQSSFQGQVWWTGEDNSTELAVITDAYIIKNTESDVLYGDADGNGEINVNDVVAVMCYTANETGNTLTDSQLNAADVFNRGDGVNSSDAVSIQKHLAKIVTVLPETYMTAE